MITHWKNYVLLILRKWFNSTQRVILIICTIWKVRFTVSIVTLSNLIINSSVSMYITPSVSVYFFHTWHLDTWPQQFFQSLIVNSEKPVHHSMNHIQLIRYIISQSPRDMLFSIIAQVSSCLLYTSIYIYMCVCVYNVIGNKEVVFC